MGFNSNIHQLPLETPVALYARVDQIDGRVDWRMVGTVCRERTGLRADLREGGATLCRPAWEACTRDTNATDPSGRSLTFGAMVSGALVTVGRVALTRFVVTASRQLACELEMNHRPGLRGRVHSSLRSSWPNASCLAATRKREVHEGKPA